MKVETLELPSVRLARCRIGGRARRRPGRVVPHAVLSLLRAASLPCGVATAEDKASNQRTTALDKPIPEPNVYDSDTYDTRPRRPASPPSGASPSGESEDEAPACCWSGQRAVAGFIWA